MFSSMSQSHFVSLFQSAFCLRYCFLSNSPFFFPTKIFFIFQNSLYFFDFFILATRLHFFFLFLSLYSSIPTSFSLILPSETTPKRNGFSLVIPYFNFLFFFFVTFLFIPQFTETNVQKLVAWKEMIYQQKRV